MAKRDNDAAKGAKRAANRKPRGTKKTKKAKKRTGKKAKGARRVRCKTCPGLCRTTIYEERGLNAETVAAQNAEYLDSATMPNVWLMYCPSCGQYYRYSIESDHDHWWPDEAREMHSLLPSNLVIRHIAACEAKDPKDKKAKAWMKRFRDENQSKDEYS